MLMNTLENKKITTDVCLQASSVWLYRSEHCAKRHVLNAHKCVPSGENLELKGLTKPHPPYTECKAMLEDRNLLQKKKQT